MKKNILFLINGFGVEQKDSYNIYNAELMPNIDKMSRESVFKTFPNKFLDYKNAYNNFSMGIDFPLTHSLIDNNITSLEIEKNEMSKYIVNEVNKYESNFHMFCFIDDEIIYDQIIAYVNFVRNNTDCKIFLHLVLCQKSINDYKSVNDGLNKLYYDLGQRVKLGIVCGESILNDPLMCKELVKSYFTEASEKWKEISKRMDVYVQNKQAPCNARSFAVNYGYRIEEKDQILFFNFSNIDITLFKKEMEIQKYIKFDLSTVGFYSLFPLKCDVQIPFIYNYALASTCFLNNLKNINAKCLILDKKENCSFINYYLTGLKNTIDENLKYYATDDNFIYDANKLVNFLKSNDNNIYIINYNIDDADTVEKLKDKLKLIDNMLGYVIKYSNDNNIGLYVSSLYGLEKEMYNAKAELLKINFYSKVPLLIYDKSIDFAKYTIDDGNLFDLANTLLFTIDNKYPNSGILSKKSWISSFFGKKKKKEVIKKEYSVNEEKK